MKSSGSKVGLSASLIFFAFFHLTSACSSESKMKGTVAAGQAEPAPKTNDQQPEAEKKTTPVVDQPVESETPAPEPEPDLPSKAIVKGSFTVWTEPEDPAPFQDYKVFVRVSLPSDIQDYRSSDLEGQLIGTDSYEDAFGGSIEPDEFYRDDQSATLVLNVPGAWFKVEDTINVRSTLLNESQVLKIVF